MKRNIIGTNIGICNEMVANGIINRLVVAFKRNFFKTWGILATYEYRHITIYNIIEFHIILWNWPKLLNTIYIPIILLFLLIELQEFLVARIYYILYTLLECLLLNIFFHGHYVHVNDQTSWVSKNVQLYKITIKGHVSDFLGLRAIHLWP